MPIKDKAARAEYSKAYNKTHRKLKNALYNKYYKQNKAKIRAKNKIGELWRKYKLTKEEYDQMYLAQVGLCALCHEPLGKQTPHVDHCHKTGKVRGLVHNGCNVLLSRAKDDMLMLGYAIEYLHKHHKDTDKLEHIKQTLNNL